MTTPQTLLVAHDFTKRSDRALRRAQLLSKRQERIVLFHATTDARVRDALACRLRARARSILSPEAFANVLIEIEVGTPSDAAANLMQSLSGDLLVIGLHAKKGLAELLKTNTTAQMVSSAGGPTLVAKASPPRPYRRILVGIDFAEAAAWALALVRGWFPEAEVTALHAFHLLLGRRASGPVTMGDLDEGRRRWLSDAVGRADPSTSRQPVRTVVLHGSPAETLRRVATDQQYDLIVIGRHNRGWLLDAVLGSVARAILADPPCDVLVVPASATSPSI